MTPPDSVDGIAPEGQPKSSASSMKLVLMMVLLTPYVAYVLWCVFLLSVLPNPQGKYQELISVGSVSAAIFGVMLFLLGGLLVKRVLGAQGVSSKSRILSAAKIAGILLPGLVLSAMVPLTISKEPKIFIEVVKPRTKDEMIAPVTVTLSLEKAKDMLALRSLNIAKYEWDFDGDGQINEETLDPMVSALYEKKGLFQVSAILTLSDKSKRRVVYPLSIPTAVFSTSPAKPVVDQPVRFSVSHLQTDANPIKEVRWDFDGDGQVDETSTEVSAVHTYLRTGQEKVIAEILFSNQSQTRMEREVTIYEPEPLPFPVAIVTEPEYLISPPPFGVIFSIVTDVPHNDVLWNFDDGKDAIGDRVGHTFRSKGVYRVTADVRSLDGKIAKLSETVKVVEVLRLPDLQFDGFPEVKSDKLSAEVPVTVDLTPRTSQPLIEFFWEAPKATVVESTENTLRAIYRRPGNYIITLIGNDPSGSVMRKPLSLEVKEPSSVVRIRMKPDGGVAPLLVRFDASETVIPGKEITGFEWTFGDSQNAAPRQGGAQVEYLFNTPGTYTVTLAAFTTSGERFEADRTIVIRSPVLDACYTTSRTSGKAPLGVSFDMSCSTGNPTKIKWQFGDGTETDERNPIHVFERPGAYSVILELQDTAGSVSREVLVLTANP